MLEQLNLPVPDSSANVAIFRQNLSLNNARLIEFMKVHAESSQSMRESVMRQQLENMLLQTERGLENEKSARALSSLFGKFSLLQKIMQTMS